MIWVRMYTTCELQILYSPCYIQTIHAWKEQGFHQQPEHENFRQLLRAPEDDAMVSVYDAMLNLYLLLYYDTYVFMSMYVYT